MSSSRGRCNSNERGSSYDRRARRAWLLSPISGFGGDGTNVQCWECGAFVNDETLVVDRIVPGELGGTYRRSNIRPHCRTCSCRQGARRTWEIRLALDPYSREGNCKTCGVEFWEGLRNGHADGCPTPAIDGFVSPTIVGKCPTCAHRTTT